MSPSARRFQRIQIVSWILLAVVFAADLASPASMNVGMLSLAVVIFSLWSDRLNFVLTIAGMCSILVAAKLLITSRLGAGLASVDVVHAFLDWAMIWVVALSGWHIIAAAKRVQEAMTEGHGILERYVGERHAALEEQRQILHAIIECLNEGVVVVDRTRRFVVSNSTAKGVLGLDLIEDPQCSEPEPMGVFLSDRVTPCAVDQLPLARALRGEQVTGAELFLRNPVIPDGKLVAISARPWRDATGEIQGAIVIGHDLTEKKTSEHALAHSEERLRQILETAHDAFIEMNEQGLVTDWTRQGELTFGWTRDEALGRSLDELIIPVPDRPAHHKGLQRFLSTGEGPILNKRVELIALHRSGRFFPVELTISPLRDGSQVSFHAFLHDITRRKQAEEELRHSQAFYESLVDSLPLMVIRKDLHGKVTFGNKLYARDLGMPLEALIGKTDFDLFPRRLAEKYVADDQRVISEGKVVEVVEEHVDAVGQRLFVHVLKSPVRDVSGRIVGLQVLFWDVTEKRLAEEALDELQRQHELILQSAGEGIIGLDSQGVIKFANPAAAQMLGWDVNALNGQAFHQAFWQSRGNGSPVDPQANPIAESLRRGTQEHSEDDLFWRRDGSTFAVDYTINAIRDESGGIVGAVVVFEDITERKQSEIELQHTARELARSNEELQQFAYVASHDLQEPLRMVASYLQLIERRYADRLDSDANDFIHFAVDGATRMQTLINDLLAYSRVGTREKPFDLVDLDEVVSQACRYLEVSIREHGAVVDVAEMPAVLGDFTQLVQLFQNLIGNAIKFRGKETPRVGINAEQLGLEWRISVRDNGLGFDPQFSERIFDIFQRLFTRTEYPGTGIGLAICKRIVERHGGTIWANSKLEIGATFFFTIPVAGVPQT